MITAKTGHSSSARNWIARCSCNPAKLAGGSMVLTLRGKKEKKKENTGELNMEIAQ